MTRRIGTCPVCDFTRTIITSAPISHVPGGTYDTCGCCGFDPNKHDFAMYQQAYLESVKVRKKRETRICIIVAILAIILGLALARMWWIRHS